MSDLHPCPRCASRSAMQRGSLGRGARQMARRDTARLPTRRNPVAYTTLRECVTLVKSDPSGGRTEQKPNRSWAAGIRRLFAAMTLTVVPSLLTAQTVVEAAQANVALSVRLCMDVMLRQTPPNLLFDAAGFAYQGIDRGTNDYGVALGVDHFYLAPADTAKVAVNNPTGGNGICQVLTGKLGQADVENLVAAVVQQTYPQARLERTRDYWVVNDLAALPLIFNISTITTQHRYEAAGTIQVSMSFPG